MKARNHQKRKRNSVAKGVVCVIDGDEGIRNSLRLLLDTLGIRTNTFPSAEEFLDHLNGGRPSLLITELSLPGISGFELKETLDGKGIRIPVIGLTSDADSQKRREASRLGFLELIEKPFVHWSVVDRVQKTLGLPS